MEGPVAAAPAVPSEAPIERQLHDIVVPQLFVLTTGLAALQRRASSPDPLLEDLVDTANQALRDLRSISRGDATTPAGWMTEIAGSLREATASLGQLGGCTVDFACTGDLEVGAALADDLVAVVWETVANALRHGEATHVLVDFMADAGWLIVAVRDNGTWVHPTDPASSGLRGLRRRAEGWHGDLVVAHDAAGTSVEWRVRPPRPADR